MTRLLKGQTHENKFKFLMDEYMPLGELARSLDFEIYIRPPNQPISQDTKRSVYLLALYLPSFLLTLCFTNSAR